ncbi:hypothetical protein GCM10009749_20580 [Agromyces neolithicus]|uniref:Uncharacterized protein n=1 Tax=Agromyces neolithicus TaxID=269420 RepID=A0ABN2M6A1_9MICO
MSGIAATGRYGVGGAIVHLDRQQGCALTMLSIGVEKLYELTLGLAALDSGHARSVYWLWEMTAVCGRNHALGETGRTFGFEVHPDAVGRQ